MPARCSTRISRSWPRMSLRIRDLVAAEFRSSHRAQILRCATGLPDQLGVPEFAGRRPTLRRIDGGIGRRRFIWSARRNFIRRFSRQVVRRRWVDRFLHRRYVRSWIARRVFGRRLGWNAGRRRSYLWRIDCTSALSLEIGQLDGAQSVRCNPILAASVPLRVVVVLPASPYHYWPGLPVGQINPVKD
jgi:hypothetical protein